MKKFGLFSDFKSELSELSFETWCAFPNGEIRHLFQLIKMAIIMFQNLCLMHDCSFLLNYSMNTFELHHFENIMEAIITYRKKMHTPLYRYLYIRVIFANYRTMTHTYTKKID